MFVRLDIGRTSRAYVTLLTYISMCALCHPFRVKAHFVMQFVGHYVLCFFFTNRRTWAVGHVGMPDCFSQILSELVEQ